jgi:type I restriction enzyme, S subunit
MASYVNLTRGWKLATLSDITNNFGMFSDGDWVESKDQDPDGNVRLIQLADVGDGFYRDRSNRFLTYDKALKLRCTFLESGDLLIARMPDPLGRACIFPGDDKKCVTVVDVCIVRTGKDGANHRWLMHMINSPQFRKMINKYQSGSTRKRISRKNLAKIQLPLPPLPEQESIVTRIEELFTQLDAGVASLKRVKAALKRYKASVLKAAVEGRLVPQDPNDEPAEELLRRIGKKPLEHDDLPELSEGWCWVKLANLTDLISGHAFKKREYSQIGTRILQIANVSFGKIVWDQEAHLPIEYLEKFPRLVLNPGDILMALNRPILGDELKIGQVKEQDLPAILYQRVGRFDFYNTKIRPYFLIFAQSRSFINQLKKALQGVDQPFINKPSLLNFLIPLPPLEEQHRIVAEVERLLSLAEQVEVAVESSLKLAGHQRQAILKQAFEGR